MLCSRFLQAAGGGAPRALLPGHRERVRRHAARSTTRTLRWALRHRRRRARLLGSRSWSRRSGSSCMIPKGFIPSEDNGQIFGFDRGAQGISFEAMVQHQHAGRRTSSGADPNVRRSCRRSGARRQRRRRQLGPACSSQLKPRAQRKPRPTRSSSSCAPQARAASPASASYLQNPPPIRIGGRLSKSQYQFTLQGPDTRRALPLRAESCSSKMRTLAGLQDVTSDLQIANPQVNVEIDRDRAAALGVTRAADRRRALQRLRLAPGLDDLHAEQPVPGDPGARAGVPARPVGARAALRRARAGGQLVPLALARASCTERSGPLTVNHPGQLPVGHDLVQPAARRRARRRGRRRSSRPARDDAAGDDRDELPGHGAGVPGVACRAWAAPADRRDRS